MKKTPSLPDIFISFFFLGCRSFGGPAMVQNIRGLAVENKKWMREEDFRHATAFCQAIPGAIAMQVAAYVGLTTRGLKGAGAAFIGFGLPAFLLMCLFAFLYGRIGFPMSVFTGMRIAVIAIIFHAVVVLGRNRTKNWKNTLFFALGFVLFLYHVHVVFAILLSAAAGMLLLHGQMENPPVAFTSPFASSRSRLWGLSAVFLAGSLGLLMLRLFYPPLFSLCLTMTHVDLMAFGGGFASVPLMYHEVVERLAIIPSYDFVAGLILGQATPGPIVITATFVGYLAQGWKGAIASTVYVFLPSFLLVCGLSGVYAKIAHVRRIQNALEAVFVSFIGFIAGTGVRLALGDSFGLKHGVIGACLFGLLFLRIPALVVAGIGILAASLLL
ncbi:MAG: chromate efflux transporter [Fibrobacterota bacterium]